MGREPGWKRMNLNVETSLTFHGPKGAVLPPTRCARNQHSRGRCATRVWLRAGPFDSFVYIQSLKGRLCGARKVSEAYPYYGP
jgi:hypothetical protein